MSNKKEALGQGIRALLQTIDSDKDGSNKAFLEQDNIAGSIANIPLDIIEVNPFQPRAEFDPNMLQDLANSISVHGVIQPITVRKINGADKFQLIAGERRLRASKIAGKKDIPAYIRIADDQEMLEIALIENIQREDLNAMEVAVNYQRLVDECDLTHNDLAERVGKTRSSVTNFLRLLKLPDEVQANIKNKKLSMGHARSLIAIADDSVQIKICNAIIEKGLSVRKAEDLVRHYNGTKEVRLRTELTDQVLELQNKLEDIFGKNVAIKSKSGNEGEIVIKYKSESDLKIIAHKLFS